MMVKLSTNGDRPIVTLPPSRFHSSSNSHHRSTLHNAGMTDSTAGPPVPGGGDLTIPLRNLSLLQDKMDSLRQFISNSLTQHFILDDHQLLTISSHLSSAIHHIILNGAALLSLSSQPQSSPITPVIAGPPSSDYNYRFVGWEDGEIVEIDAAKLVAEHVHFCEICGKSFKRDANLRMHMRAHGNKFKTLEFLTKPGPTTAVVPAKTVKFSCPFSGCNRNSNHNRFRPLKSAICVKRHYKRTHCPKLYPCTMCNKKSFPVMADLKSHKKSCGKSSWWCSCGTSFSRKDKLFGHVSLFDGHFPVVVRKEDKRGGIEDNRGKEEEEDQGVVERNAFVGIDGGVDGELFDALMDVF